MDDIINFLRFPISEPKILRFHLRQLRLRHHAAQIPQKYKHTNK